MGEGRFPKNGNGTGGGRVNTEENAGSGEKGANGATSAARKSRRIVARTTLLALGLLTAAAATYYLAATMRGIILDMAAADRGEWASLLGGGLGVWAFFLIRSGIVEHAFDLAPKLRAVVDSLPVPEWRAFLESTLDLSKTLLMPGLVTVFALIFVGEHVAEQIIDSPEPDGNPVAVRIEALETAVSARFDRIESQIGTGNYQDALNAQGYTPERAERLDRIGPDADRSEYYFARFPIGFEAGDLNGDGTAFVRGVEYEPEKNSDILARLAQALIPCGAVGDPVILKVEGYASSESFRNTTAEVTSEELNIRIANERRRSVKEALDAAIAATGFAGARSRIVVTEADDYRTLAEMEADREFNDRPAGEDVNTLPQDFLTRAAHVKVMSPGTCRVNTG